MSRTCWFIGAGIVGCSLICGALIGDRESQTTYAQDKKDEGRTRSGLLALYDFSSENGEIVKDRSGVGDPVDLRIEDPKAVRRSKGSLEVRGKTVIRSDKAADRISKELRRSRQFTLEAWIRPAKTDLTGPARIVTLSRNSNERNFTLGQDGNRFEMRFRTNKTSANGIPAVNSAANSLSRNLTHVVYTRNRSGRARFYINGRPRGEKLVDGVPSNWNNSFQLALANEITGDRPWQGTYHLVAIYRRALTAGEVRQNFEAGNRSKPAVLAADASATPRVISGLRALYTFDSGGGDTVRDRSGSDQPLDLKIAKPSAVRWQDGALVVRSSTKIQSSRPAKEITEVVKRTGALTIEAWVRPAGEDQSGPARIVSLSSDIGQRNFTLGQEGKHYDVRFRTSATDRNGSPSTATPDGTLRTAKTHVVYTHDKSGNARIYIDGQQRASKKISGNVSNWQENFPLVLANEVTGDRTWLGTFYLVAVYGRELSAAEVEQNFRAGTDTRGTTALAQRKHEQFFETQIASLLANHCLECHDPASRKGRLDLSRKAAAFAGGENGKAIIPGKAEESLLWQYVESDEMPKDRSPLSQGEKQLLKQWIDEGAAWSLEEIDPAIFVHEGRAGNKWVQRLTIPEYIETVRSAVGVDISEEARKILPPDLRADGFSNTAYNLNVDLKHVDAYAKLAEIIVERMDVLKFAQRFSKSRLLSTDDTMRQFVAAMGKWLLRGPLDEREVTSFSGIATTVASAGGDYEEAASLVIEAMLQSPRFIYRVENQRGDGTAWPVGEYELASRLSYIIWGGPPDRELMRAADAGELSDRGICSEQVRRMLQDPRAVKRSTQFIAEWLNLNRLGNMQPSREKFPNWDPQLAADMRAETLEFFKEIAWKQKRPLSELLNAQMTFATPRLAKHYGLESNGKGLSRYDLSKVKGRGGLLTHGSVLTIGGDEASMVTRGLFVLKDLLRGTVKDPPPCVDTTPVPSKAGLTQRGIAESRIANVACGGCHAKFEPLAFGLEKFNGLGAYHEKDEHGNKLRDDGKILIPGAAESVSYQTSAELMDLLAGSERVRETITWKLTQFALGRPPAATDARTVGAIHTAAWKEDGAYADLITAIVMSDLVQKTRTELVR